MKVAVAMLVVMGTAACASAPRAESQEALVARARAIHDRVLTMDTHVDIQPAAFTEAQPNYVSGGLANPNQQVDLPRMERGGLDAVFFSIYQGQQQDFTPEGYRRAYDVAMAKVEAVRRMTTTLAPGRIGLATTAADVRRVAASGRKVALMGMENGYALGEDVGNVKTFADLGVRYLSLAHNGNNQLSDSNNGQPDGERHGGLSALGRRVVAEANRFGVMLDISHPSKKANLQTMQLARAPVIASHSAMRALADHSRNLDDEELLALKRNGGVVQVVAFAAYLKVQPAARTAALDTLRREFGLASGGSQALRALTPERRAEYDARLADIDRRHPAPPRATVRDLVDHVDYAVKRIGIDHVGISSDFDGGGGVEGWSDATETFNVTLELVRRGYSEAEIAKIWSGNLLRVMEAAERVAAQLQRGG